MTFNALHRRLRFIQVPFVTGLALRFGMPTLQGIVGIFAMVETHLRPFVEAMAGLAFFTILPLMLIIFLMTGETVFLDFHLVGVFRVTGIA